MLSELHHHPLTQVSLSHFPKKNLAAVVCRSPICKTVCRIHTKSGHVHKSRKWLLTTQILFNKIIHAHNWRQYSFNISQFIWICVPMDHPHILYDPLYSHTSLQSTSIIFMSRNKPACE